MKRKILVIAGIVTAVVMVSACIVAKVLGVDLFATASGLSEGKPLEFASADDLISGKAYVWHHDGADIKDDLDKKVGKNVFFTCITGDYNFKNQELEEELNYPRSIWIDSEHERKEHIHDLFDIRIRKLRTMFLQNHSEIP